MKIFVRATFGRTGKLTTVCVLLIFAATQTVLTPVMADTLPQTDIDAIYNWPFYAPDASCGDGQATTLTGSEADQQAFNFFVQQGLTAIQSAGIVGNLVQESNVNPEDIQDPPGGTTQDPSNLLVPGWGIAQWTPGVKIIATAAQLNITTPIYELVTQLNIVWGQMEGTSPNGTKNTLQDIKQATTVQVAVDTFMNDFESPGVDGPRVTDAEQILQQYGGSAASQATAGSSSGQNACGSTTSANSSGFKSPFCGTQNLVPERIDEGVDYSGSGPICAMTSGTIMAIDGSGWPGGIFIVYKLSNPPNSNFTYYIYVAEDCTPNGLTPGENVTSSTVICNMYEGPDGIETGWAQAPSHGDIAMAYSEYAYDGLATNFGQNFSQLLQSVGAPPGVISKSSGISNTPLPQGWPTWN